MEKNAYKIILFLKNCIEFTNNHPTDQIDLFINLFQFTDCNEFEIFNDEISFGFLTKNSMAVIKI